MVGSWSWLFFQILQFMTSIFLWLLVTFFLFCVCETDDLFSSECGEHMLRYSKTVEPLYNGHLGDRRKWPLWRGGRCREVAIVERWPLVEVRPYSDETSKISHQQNYLIYFFQLHQVCTSCFCYAELYSFIDSTKAWVQAGRQLSLTRSAFLHDFGTAVIQTTCLCHVELNS